MKEITVGKNSWTFLTLSPVLLLGVPAGYCRRDLVDKSGMLRSQMGNHNRLVMGAVHWKAYALPSRNNNGNSKIKLMNTPVTESLNPSVTGL
jgi:hypothetical protein